MSTMQYWYDHGIRMIKFDFVDFGAATPHAEKSQTPEETDTAKPLAYYDQPFFAKYPAISQFIWQRHTDVRGDSVER
jgi:hypothetical protein